MATSLKLCIHFMNDVPGICFCITNHRKTYWYKRKSIFLRSWFLWVKDFDRVWCIHVWNFSGKNQSWGWLDGQGYSCLKVLPLISRDWCLLSTGFSTGLHSETWEPHLWASLLWAALYFFTEGIWTLRINFLRVYNLESLPPTLLAETITEICPLSKGQTWAPHSIEAVSRSNCKLSMWNGRC